MVQPTTIQRCNFLYSILFLSVFFPRVCASQEGPISFQQALVSLGAGAVAATYTMLPCFVGVINELANQQQANESMDGWRIESIKNDPLCSEACSLIPVFVGVCSTATVLFASFNLVSGLYEKSSEQD